MFLIPNAANTAEVVRRLAAAAPRGHRGHRTCTSSTASSPCRARAATRCCDALGLPTGHDYMSFVEADWQGRPVIVCRTGYTGERGYELVPRWDDAPARCGTR